MSEEKSHGWAEQERMKLPGLDGTVRVFFKDACRVLIGHEDKTRKSGKLWHLSISRPDRYPSWDEIKDARYALLPLGLTFAMLLPPPGEYVNVHHNCFHLWEVPEGIL